MNRFDNSANNDYRAPYLQLDKEQMADPFGWLQSQGSVNVRAILKQMNLDDRKIDCLLRNYCPKQGAEQSFAKYRQQIGQKAIQLYKKWQWDNELSESKKTPESERKGVVKVNESQLRKVITECVKSVLKEDAYYDGRYGESRIPSSYIADAAGQIDMVKNRLSNLTNHIYSICDGMTDEEYAFGYMDSSNKTIDTLRKIWPLLKELCDIWGYRAS